MKELVFSFDEGVHRNAVPCPACLDGYPKKHDCAIGMRTMAGLLHAEYRISMEAGFTFIYRLERCDSCDYEAFIELKGEEYGAANAAISKQSA